MQRLNFHHLHYFWSVAKEGSMAKAAAKLHLTQPTISAQIALFETTIGQVLFHRMGRRLELTETGRDVFDYAEEIFALGRDLTQYLNGRSVGRGYRLVVGVSDNLPKLVVLELLKPAFQLTLPVRLHCQEDKIERLLNELALNAIDLVLTTGPLPFRPDPALIGQRLSDSPLAVYGIPSLAERYRCDFPESLSGAPFLFPLGHSGYRQDFERWCEKAGIWPEIRAEISDSALIKTFAAEGLGLCLAPRLIEPVITRQYGLESVGVIESLRESYYLFTAQRKHSNPVLAEILRAALSVSSLPGE